MVLFPEPAFLTPPDLKAVKQMNQWGAQRLPFLFIIDFDFQKPILRLLNEIDENEILFEMGFSSGKNRVKKKDFAFHKYPVSFSNYNHAFQTLHSQFLNGATFLVNLTFSTPIETSLSLMEIYQYSKAKYKLWYNNEFTVFSPECFVKIEESAISTYPMKGTIDAAIPNAREILLADGKELAEHTTIVDLLRNDLNRVAGKVSVEKFRYVEEIQTHEKKLLQVSSKITGELPGNWQSKIGDILLALLPAGSVTGAPKRKTLEIINAVETHKRGYYTGIFGVFDGKNLDSAVMIRFIERKSDGSLFFKSGGGITYDSDAKKEYEEMADKVYVPIN